jgi:prolyl oligopeptidase
MWRRVKYGALAAVAFGLATIETTWAADFSNPETRRETVTDTYHGVVVSDPYRWLESANSSEVKDWLDRENAITDGYLDKTQQWRAIAQRLTVLTKVQSKEYQGFRYVGGVSFVLYKDPAKHQVPVLAALHDVDAATLKVILDPRCVGDAGCGRNDQTIDWFVPSPDGRKVAVSVSGNGSEAGMLHVFDIATVNEMDRPIARAV